MSEAVSIVNQALSGATIIVTDNFGKSVCITQVSNIFSIDDTMLMDDFKLKTNNNSCTLKDAVKILKARHKQIGFLADQNDTFLNIFASTYSVSNPVKLN